jgi:predicted O-linked N-acetylglucosamine transferase (SPINDLY family)
MNRGAHVETGAGTATVEQSMQQAVAHHLAGRLHEAERLYRAILRMQPNHSDANRNLALLLSAQGKQIQSNSKPPKPAAKSSAHRDASPQEISALMVLFNQGRYKEMEIAARDLTLRFPRHGIGWKALGAALEEQGRNAEALLPLQKATELLQGDAGTHNNLGNLLKEQGRLPEAEANYRQALKIKPDYTEACYNLGILLKEKESFPEAEAMFRRALKGRPDFAEAHNNLGFIFKEQGNLREAEACYRRAVGIKPTYAEAYYNLGVIFNGEGHLAEAEACYRRALEGRPGFAEAHFNLGVILMEQDCYAEAEACYRRAIAIKPDYFEAHTNLGIMLKEQGQLVGAETSYRRALEIKPDFAEAHNNLGDILKEQGRFPEAETSLLKALEIKPDYVLAQDNLLFALNFTASHSPQYCLEQAFQYGKTVEKKVGERFSSWQCATQPERLRVGLVSGDLREHSVSHFLESLLNQLDPVRVELFAYPTHNKVDELTARIKPYFNAWKPLAGLGDEAASRLIHADGVHILFDLSGHTALNRLPVFAWKPAPVQVSWLGFLGTTGLAEMDYVLGDPLAIPPEDEENFSEDVWRMPESFLCFTPPTPHVTIAPLPAIATGHVTFGSFNNLSKMGDAVVALWANVLKAAPHSRLFLKAMQLNGSRMRETTLQRFAAHGITANRLELEEGSPRAEMLEDYNRVDIALDPFPYSGCTTSVEALWMGVPVLTLRGDKFISRTTESIVHNAGLPGWIAADHDSYVAKAVAYATDLEGLATLRIGLRQQVLASPLFDAPRFARNFEAALLGMWQRYQTRQGASL